MLPPHELKNKPFSKSMRGYNPVEVDEYIAFLIEKYTELYRENDELERKLKAAVTRLDEVRDDEDSIRSVLIDAKRAANRIKADAEERAESIVRSAKSSCNTILSDFNEKIEIGRNTLAEIQRDAFDLKQELYERYSAHIQFIEKLTEGLDDSVCVPDTDELRRDAVDSLKSSIADMYKIASDDAAAEDEPGEYEDDDPTNTTQVYDVPEFSTPANDDSAYLTEGDPLVVDREPLITETPKTGLKDSVKELNRIYRNSENDVINTPDSDVGDDASYLDFVKAMNGRNDGSKDEDLNILFDDGKKKKKKK